MNRYQRLIEDILTAENDPLRLRYHNMTPHDRARLTVGPEIDTVEDWFIGFGSSWLHGIKVNPDTQSASLQQCYDMAVAEVFQCMCTTPDLVDNWGSVSNIRQDVLVQMVYQLGLNGVRKFKNMIVAINANQYDVAAIEMLDSRWAKQTARRAGLLATRMEDNLWKSLA